MGKIEYGKLDYRTDIEGLRAVAVLPVILFHAGLGTVHGIPLAPGGFIGVDIFFVISGFLISGKIYSEINERNYSLISFYSRRVRRIFPALMVLYFAIILWATFFGLADDARNIKNAVVSSLIFSSNVYFASQAGYFDASIQSNPLLHTWSLSIEEQFYLIFPFLIIFIRRFSNSIRMLFLIVVAIIGLCSSVYISNASPDTAYYSFFARYWELAIGGILAISQFRLRSPGFAQNLAIVGLIAIAISILGFSERTVFPSYTALMPTFGAAAIILSGTGHNTLISNLLSFKPIRWIGQISYSLYLWHWPILVIMKLEYRSGYLASLVAITVCFAVAWLSWRCVEQPFRKQAFRFSPSKTVFLGLLSTLTILLFSVYSPTANRMLFPMNEEARKFAEYDPAASEDAMHAGTCFLTSKFNDIAFFEREKCLHLKPKDPNVLIMGDSHAAQYVEGFRERYPQVNFLQANASGCLPITGSGGEIRCTSLLSYLLDEFLPHNYLDGIVLVARWKSGTGYDAFRMAQTLLKFSSRIIIIGPNQEYTTPMPRLLVKAAVNNDYTSIERAAMAGPQLVDKEFRSVKISEPRITYISYFQTVCRNHCPYVSSTGEPLLFDDNHLSRSAALDFVGLANKDLRFEK